MKTNTDSVPAPVLNEKYLWEGDVVTFNATSLTVHFKDGSVFSGNATELREHIRATNAAIKNALNHEGKKVAVFHTFRPTTKDQRQLLGLNVGWSPDNLKGQVFSFGNVHQARRFYKQAKEKGCEGNPDRNWPLVTIDSKTSCPL